MDDYLKLFVAHETDVIMKSCNACRMNKVCTGYYKHSATKTFKSLSVFANDSKVYFTYLKVKFSLYRPGVAQKVGRSIALLLHHRGTIRG